MLVVSRKENQSVVFPKLGISVEILRVAGKAVRVGVQAPDDVRILRGELVNSDTTEAYDSADAARRQTNHDLRNRLNKARLALTLLEKQLAAGRITDAEESLAIALKTFDEMERATNGAVVAESSTHFDVGTRSVAAPNRQPKRALLVEDDPNERMLLASYLQASGYEVDTAEDGQAALDYLAERKPDAVVMDMEMPRLNGRETIQAIRRQDEFNDMKVFVVSGLEQKATQVPSGDRGVQRWFQKPLRPEDLVDELSSLN